LFDYSGFSFFVLDDTLHFNLNHLELEEEYPLYKLPSNMYLSEDYLLVKEKIIPLLAQSLNNWIAEIENPKILNKLEFKEQYNTVATVWEFVVSFYRNVFRFFGLSTDRIVDFFYDLFLKYGFYSGSNYEAFFYVFDNFKQPFIGFEDNINNYTVEYRNYGRIENPGRGNKLSFVEKELPDVFDFVPGANTYPEAKQLKIFDEFFAYYRKFFLWEQNTVSQRNVSLTKLKNVGKNNILSLDLTWMKPVYKLGYDIEFNLYKNIEINKNFVMLSFFLDKSVHIKSRIEGQLSDYDTMVRDLLNSKKMEFPVKDRDMFPMVKDRTEFFSYFRRMESNRINESSVSDFSNLSSLGYKELIVGDDFENDFWKGDLTTKYLYTYDLNFLKLLWKS
jgi:hypothetical protein